MLTIRKQLNLGVKNFRKAWKNLEELGCIEDHGQTSFNGQFGCKQFVIYEYSNNLKDLDSLKTPSNKEIKGRGCSAKEPLGNVDTLVHDGLVHNVKSTDGNQIDTEVYIAKETSNNYQSNQKQGNQKQGNKLDTNDFDENQNSLVLQVPLSDSGHDYFQIAKDHIERIQSSSFYHGWEKYERKIILESTLIGIFFDCFDDIHKGWIYNIYKWVLFLNEKMFQCNVDYWRLYITQLIN